MEDKSEISKREALRCYREAGKGLFDESPIIDLNHDGETTNADRILRRLQDATRLFKNYQVRVRPFDEDDVEIVAAALTMPTLLTYTDWIPTEGDKAKPFQREYDPPETEKVNKIQKAVRDYCFEAADLAHRTRSESEKDWKRAFNTIDRECLQGCVTFPSCSPADSAWIAGLVAEGPDTLRSDIMVFRRELKREIDGLIGSLVAAAERTLQKIRGNAKAEEVAVLVNAFAVDTFDDVVAFVDKAITYGFHSNSDDYEEYDAYDIGAKLHEIAKLRFPNDPTCYNACEKAIDDFMFEIDRSCEVYRGSLIQGLTESGLAVYEWLTRKDPAANNTAKSIAAAVVQEIRGMPVPRPKPSRKPQSRLVIPQRRVAEDTGKDIRTVQKWETGELTPPSQYSRTVRQTVLGYETWLGIYKKNAEFKKRHGTTQSKKLPYKETATEKVALVKNDFRYDELKV